METEEVPTLDQIASDLQLAEDKKNALRDSFLDLHSSFSSSSFPAPFCNSFNLQWPDIEPHFDLIRSSLEDRLQHLQSRENLLESRLKTLETNQGLIASTQRIIDEQRKDLESKEKQLEDDVRAKATPLGFPGDADASSSSSSSSATLRFWITMDGEKLLRFLNGNAARHDSMGDEVFWALRMSADPALLVLDAVKGFYGEKNEEEGFETGIVRRSCVLLLEQMKRMRPLIRESVRAKAAELAGEWRKGMMMVFGNKDKDPSMEVLGFVLLIAAYELVSDFDRVEILRLLEAVSDQRLASELHQSLDVVGKNSCTQKEL